MRLVVGASLFLFFASLLSGCGPILSSVIIVRAEAAVEGAKTAEADKYATYEYVAATEYLHKAREEQGYADFGPAIDFATKAEDLAKKSMDRAEVEKTRLGEESSAGWQAPQDGESTPAAVMKKAVPAKNLKKDAKKPPPKNDKAPVAPSPRDPPAPQPESEKP